MTSKIFAYQDDADTRYGFFADPDQQALIDDIMNAVAANNPAAALRIAPFIVAYDDLEALQAVVGWDDAIMAPAGLTMRRWQMGLSDTNHGASTGQGIASLSIVVGDFLTWVLLEPTGPNPIALVGHELAQMLGTVTAAIGESRQ